MAISLPDARHLPDEVLLALRLRALHAYELGTPKSKSLLYSASVVWLCPGGGPPTIAKVWRDCLRGAPADLSAPAVG